MLPSFVIQLLEAGLGVAMHESPPSDEQGVFAEYSRTASDRPSEESPGGFDLGAYPSRPKATSQSRKANSGL